jgi:preprotein translocase subunit SecG
MIETILAVLVSLASIAMIVVVLLQSGKKAGLSGAIAGGSDSYMSKNKSGDLDQKLASSTKWIALVWIVLVLLMSLV